MGFIQVMPHHVPEMLIQYHTMYQKCSRTEVKREFNLKEGQDTMGFIQVMPHHVPEMLIQYHTMYQKCSRTEVKREFNLKEGKIPWDLSR